MIWLALVVYLACLAGGATFAVVEGLGLWRRIKRTGGALSAETGRITSVLDGLSLHFDRMNVSTGALQASLGHMATSRARLDVQVRAIKEARQTIGRLLWFLPGA